MHWSEVSKEWILDEKPNQNEIISYPIDDNGKEARWKWSLERLKSEVNEVSVRPDRTDNPAVYIKSRMNDEGMLPLTWWDKKEYSATSYGTNHIKGLFEQAGIFDYPKSIHLMEDILRLTTDINSTVLDFFSGSATTAHATMQLNAEDGGSRKWIMVQLPELTATDSTAYKAGYKSIPEISRERIRRAGEKIKKEHPDANIDDGFRTLNVADTNYKDVFRPATGHTQENLFDKVNNIKEDRSDLDLLYGILIHSALELNRPISNKDISGSEVYLYDYFDEVSGLAACFSDSVSEETIKAIATLKPLTAVFKDSSFPDSQAKVNLSEHFRILSPDTKVRVI
jgi:adenine-specific DNA-methyltransferase